ncbi:HelD family protein [Streptomyces sp. SP18CS02]|uniref:HelD family protein n=1 Tax=Streptomyces sp. SP18CS02 TaxID=3002531 RepID=UPI002E7A55CB|nr:AAA family ATPase [Streptomyces sp. SP18CS02]MEE1755585.1 AAA family ATPase [Streptomyces sp. SP18CS02]
MTSLDHALDQERTYHDGCRAALNRMIEGAARQVVTGEDVSASGADAEALGHHLRSRAKELREEPRGPLFFGRLDHEDGQSHHIGRRRIGEDPAAPPLVIDWRAPVSRVFYQASARDPQGVRVRRRFGWAPAGDGSSRDLTGLEDEHLGGDGRLPDAGTEEGAGTRTATGGVVGAILAGEIERPRVGPMRDIAATIQPEQDDLVRAGLADSLCVQGAPGTGKTAVGLHRAAYLLYTHPQRIRRGGMLILGPNRAFLSYISEVLPALGELDIRQSTVDDEIARHEVRAQDSPEAAAVKHDVRMAAVLHRALYARVRAPHGPLTVPDGSYRRRVPLAVLEEIVAGVRAEAPPYAVGRERLRSRVVRELQLQAERRAGPVGAAWVRRIERARPVTALVDACWPKVTPEEVLAEVLTLGEGGCDDGSSDDGSCGGGSCGGGSSGGGSCGGGSCGGRGAEPSPLTPAEWAAIRWARPPRSYRSAGWSAADLVLLDELAGLIERPGGYGHIVIDEAQDLSPMQCRAIARRADFGSLTVLGDLAQGTTPWAARSWEDQLAHLGRKDAPVIPLTTGFRVPAAIVELANRLLGGLGVDVPPARSLRTDGELTVREVADVAAATVDAVRAALAREGSIGVIAADADAGRLGAALAGAGIAAAPVDDPGAGRVTVLPATLAKGLEYDHVVVAEPAAIVDAEPRGLHRLYVVLTRSVSRLDILHTRPLPPECLPVPNRPRRRCGGPATAPRRP